MDFIETVVPVLINEWAIPTVINYWKQIIGLIVIISLIFKGNEIWEKLNPK